MASNFFFDALRRSQNIIKTEIIRSVINPTVKPAYSDTERDPAEGVPELEPSLFRLPGIAKLKGGAMSQ